MKGINLNISSTSDYSHSLSHRKIHARLWVIECYDKLPDTSFERVKIENIHTFAVSRLMEKFIETKI